MVFTSYYAKLAKLNGKKISISSTTPAWAQVDGHWKQVKPPWSLVEKYKADADEAAYTEAYSAYLAGLDLSKAVDKLKTAEEDIFLLCYEASGKFCHRHLLADHLKANYGLDVQEY